MTSMVCIGARIGKTTSPVRQVVIRPARDERGIIKGENIVRAAGRAKRLITRMSVHKVANMNTKRVWIVIFVLMCLLTIPGESHAQQIFYDGNIVIDSIHADVVIGDEASVFIEYLLINEGDEEESITLVYPSVPVQLRIGDQIVENPLVLGPHEEMRISLSYVSEISEGATRSFSFSPSLTFNDLPNGHRVRRFAVGMLLPEGISSIIGSNKPYSAVELTGQGRAYYTWDFTDIYATRLSILWSTLGVDLSVEKSVSPEKITSPDQVLQVEVTIQNQGSDAVSNITLTDDYVPSDFEAVEPLDDFTLTDLEQSDPRLFWSQTIAVLQPGDTQTFRYSIRYVGDTSTIHDFILAATRVTVDDQFVNVSNQVRLSKLVGAQLFTGLIEEQEVSTPSSMLPLLLAGLGVLLGIVMLLVGVILFRRQRSS